MGLYTITVPFYNDEDGRALSKAALWFYESGTYNEQNTYADPELTVENPNPVIADSAGRFQEIYLDDSLEYRVVLQSFERPDVYTDVWVRDNITGIPTIGTESGQIPLSDDVVINVASISELTALSAFDGMSAMITETGRVGLFTFDNSDLSAEIAADTEQGSYAAPDSDDTGASGAWVRVDKIVDLKSYGAEGNGTTDDDDAITGAVANESVVLVPEGEYSGTAVSLGNETKMDMGSKISSTVTIGEESLGSQFLDLTDYADGAIKTIRSPRHTITANSYAGDTDDWRKAIQYSRVYYDGAATASRALGGAVYGAHVDYGFNSDSDNPASGTYSMYEGSMQIKYAEGADASSTQTELTPIAVGLNIQDTEDGYVPEGINLYNDFVIHGPKTSDSSQREQFLAGLSVYVAKYAPGVEVDETNGKKGQAGVSIWTNPGGGGFKGGQDKTGWTSYMMATGINIGGWSGTNGSANDGYGSTATPAYQYGIKIGGAGNTVWAYGNSKIENGAYILDYTDTGIIIGDAHPDAVDPVAIGISGDGGNVGIGTKFPDADAKLHINGTAAYDAVRMSYGDEYFKWRVTSAGQFNLVASNASSGSSDTFPIQVSNTSINAMIVLDVDNTTIKNLKLDNLSTYADDAAAGTGGLTSGEVYQTSTGELRVKL